MNLHLQHLSKSDLGERAKHLKKLIDAYENPVKKNDVTFKNLWPLLAEEKAAHCEKKLCAIKNEINKRTRRYK